MSEINQNIQKKEFERRLHILKGFTNIDEIANVHIQQLEKAVGSENIYEYSGLQKLTQDVLAKGDKAEIFKAKKFINELNPVNVIGEDGLPTTVFLEKGHMDFSNSRTYADNAENRKKNRVGQQYGGRNVEDKNVDNSTKDNDPPKEQNEGAKDYDKSPEDWVTETSSEDLKKFVDTADDSQIELIELAEEELMNRGEYGTDPDNDPGNPENQNSETNQEQEDEAGRYDDELSLDEMNRMFWDLPDDQREQIIGDSIRHNVSPITAMKFQNMHVRNNEETHAKIDAAQAALDELKGATGHPDTNSETVSEDEVKAWVRGEAELDKEQLEQFLFDNPNFAQADILKNELANWDEEDVEDMDNDSESSKIADQVEKETYTDDGSQYKKDVQKDEQSYKDQVDSDEAQEINDKIDDFTDDIIDSLNSDDIDSIINSIEHYQESYLGTMNKLLLPLSEEQKSKVNEIWNEYSGNEGRFEDYEKGFFDSEDKEQAEQLASKIGGEIEEQGGLIYVYDKDGNIYNG